jgi:hypothetical protein
MVATESPTWIFFIFRPSKICVSTTDVASSLSSSRCCLSPNKHHYVITSCHASFTWSQHELIASASSSGNASSYHILSWTKTEAFNSYRHRRPPSPNSLSPTTMGTLFTTQQCLHFTFSVAKTSHHRSSTRRRYSLSLSSHIHHPSVQRHTHQWTSQPFFIYRTAYRYVNLYKKNILKSHSITHRLSTFCLKRWGHGFHRSKK